MSAINVKTRELCQVILDQPEFQSIRQRIDTFLADDDVRTQYETLTEAGQSLQSKQQTGMPLSGEEISDFEEKREVFLSNPVAKGFIDAQQDMHKMREEITRYIARTFELGRVPEPEDLETCGHGCSCGH